MTYIDLINSFWEKDLEANFSSGEATFYFYLLNTCNRLAWKNPFGLSNAVAMAKFGWSKSSFDTIKKSLKNAGLISFKAGDGRGNVYQYTVLGIKDTEKVYKKLPLSPTLSPTLSLPLSDTLSGLKQYTSIDKDKDLDKEKEGKDVRKKSKAFVKPTLEEVAVYCQERSNSVSAQQFINHYESNGWMVGKNRMKDWKAAVRTWESNNFDNEPKNSTSGSPAAEKQYGAAAWGKEAE
jgi:hypothetical protein